MNTYMHVIAVVRAFSYIAAIALLVVASWAATSDNPGASARVPAYMAAAFALFGFTLAEIASGMAALIDE